jgi:hypothetical protein
MKLACQRHVKMEDSIFDSLEYSHPLVGWGMYNDLNSKNWLREHTKQESHLRFHDVIRELIESRWSYLSLPFTAVTGGLKTLWHGSCTEVPGRAVSL